MRPSFWHRIDFLARRLTPFAITLLLVVLGQIPTGIPMFAEVAPVLALMSIYHWAVYRPELLPSYGVFFIGIVQDALSGAPLGIHALIFVLLYMAVLSQRGFLAGRAFSVIWLGFAMTAMAGQVLLWLVMAMYQGALMPVRPVAVQFILTLMVFPLLARVFARWQRLLLDEV